MNTNTRSSKGPWIPLNERRAARAGILLLLLLLLTLPAAAQAQFTCVINNGAITITGLSMDDWDFPLAVVIPSTIGGLPVTSIGDYAFSWVSLETGTNRILLTSVTIPDSVTNIGSSAFFNSPMLTSVTIPNSVTSIGNQAFGSCDRLSIIMVDVLNPAYSSVDGVLLDKSQTTLIEYPGGKAGSYTIPDSVTSIGGYAFSDCARLTSVTLGNSVTSIGDWAFSDCISLTNVTLPNGVTSIGEFAFCDCSSLTIVTIPNSVTSIVAWAFAGCSGLKSVTIPDSVTSIGSAAFEYCTSLTNVTIGNSVVSIGSRAFYFCASLTAVTVDALNSVYSSVDGVLFNKSQTTLIQCPEGKAGEYTIPNSVTWIADYAIEECHSLTSVTIPNGVTSIGDQAFYSCTRLTTITIPNSVTSIGRLAFCLCANLSSVTIPNNVTSILDATFQDCYRLTSVTIGNGVTSVGYGAFSSCTSLTSVTIGNSVTSIGIAAFGGCASLTSVTIPNTLTTIGGSAWEYCTNLTSILFQGNAPTADSSVFDGDSNATVYYLPGTTGWGSSFGGLPTALWQSQSPGVWTLSASPITPTGATLNGTVNPNGWPTTAWFQWGTTANYGNLTSVTDVGSGTNALPFSAPLAGLAPGVTYHFRVAATNDNGLVYGSDQSFTTLGLPQISTLAATDVSTNSATLNGTVNPNGYPTTAWFQWGNTTNYGNLTSVTNLGSGTTALPLSVPLAGLTPSVTYHFRIVATNDHGLVYGSDQSFTTASLLPPQVSTLPATGVTTNSATLNGTVNPNGWPTAAWFEWGNTTSYGNLTAATALGSGTTALPLSVPLAGLTPSVTYHFRLAATNDNGLVYGSDQSFATLGPPPQASTLPATGVSPNSATLNGSVNPNGWPTTAWFQWGTTANYGNLTSVTALGSGTTILPLSVPLAGLTSGVTYHFRLAATNDNGVVYGSDQSFTTQAQSGEAGWTLNGGATMTGNIITLTVGAGDTSRSAFLNNKQDVTAFHIVFCYQDVSGAASADGVTFCIQNDPRGPTALGGGNGGSSLGYDNITPSVALAMNIYDPNTRGIAFAQNGARITPYQSLLPDVDIGGNTNIIQVNVDYNGTVMTMTFKDTVTGGIASTNWTVNIPSVVGGSTAYVGFTGADGGVASIQTISWVGSPPTILIPPRTQTAEAGSATGFRVEASGSLPLFYLWYLNNTNLISSGTNWYSILTDVQFGQSGAYTVVVSNVLGAATSPPALLNVIVPVEHRPVPGVKVTGEAGSSLNLDYADSLSPAPNWTTLGSVSLTGTPQYYFDLTIPLPPQRYFRAWQAGTPSVLPSLDLHLVPAITLTGNIGGSVRLDYINQFGPIDAWVTLDTVPLTNTSQLYFDISAPGHPPRLYRVVQMP